MHWNISESLEANAVCNNAGLASTVFSKESALCENDQLTLTVVLCYRIRL